MEFGASFDRHKHDAPILNEHGVQAEYARNGLCPYHPDIQLRKKTFMVPMYRYVRSLPVYCANIHSLLDSTIQGVLYWYCVRNL